MYVFGGRGVDGKDLGDLAAFKISSMFFSFFFIWHNFGPLISIQTNGGTCSRIWDKHLAEGLGMRCPPRARAFLSWVGSRSD
jgi:hypothetical protein